MDLTKIDSAKYVFYKNALVCHLYGVEVAKNKNVLQKGVMSV